MSDHLPALAGGLLPYKLERQVSKAVARIDAAQMVAMHRDQAHLDRIAGTTRHGMLRAAELGVLEATLIQMAPNAAGYVHACAVGGAIGLASVVHDASRGA
jgi:hypothetical protein